MTVEEIIKDYLKENGFDGLCNSYAECGCNIDELIACGNDCSDCEPGYKIGAKSLEYNYFITTKKPKP